MNLSDHTLTCGMITTTGSILNFIFDNSKGGWVLAGLSIIIFIITVVLYKIERRNEK